MTLYLLFISKYWSDVIQNAIGCAIGGGLAIIVSILIYWLTIRETEKSSRKAIEQVEQSQLKAFALMIKDAINFTEKQFSNTNEFITQLKSHPNTFPLLQMHPLGTLKRIIDTITVEKTGITYMKCYPGKNSAKEFIAILDTVDFLHAEYLALKEHLANASKNHTEWQYKISHFFDISDKLLWDHFASATKEDTIANQIWPIKQKFLKHRTDGSDIHYVNEYYFIPLTEFTGKLMNNPSPFVSDLHYNLQKGGEHYQYFNNAYDLFVEEMTEIQRDIAVALTKLKIEAENILKLNDL
jgi:hypothetical protein